MIPLPTSAPDLPAPPAEGVEPLLTIDQLADWLGATEWYIRQAARRKDDPFPLIGSPRVLRAVPSEVVAWMKRQRTAEVETTDS